MDTFREILKVIIIVGGICSGIFVGVYLMLICPIMNICAAVDAGNITATLIGWSIIKIILALPTTWAIWVVSLTIGAILSD